MKRDQFWKSLTGRNVRIFPTQRHATLIALRDPQTQVNIHYKAVQRYCQGAVLYPAYIRRYVVIYNGFSLKL
jgi:hypothetical protein